LSNYQSIPMGGAATGLPFFPGSRLSICQSPMNGSLRTPFCAKIDLVGYLQFPKPRHHTLGTVRSAVHLSGRVLALLALVTVVLGLPTKAAAKVGPVWVRLELVENTADGSAFNRCEIERTLK